MLRIESHINLGQTEIYIATKEPKDADTVLLPILLYTNISA